MQRYLSCIECIQIRKDVHFLLKARNYIIVSTTVLDEEFSKYLLVIEGLRIRNELICELRAKGYTVISQTLIPEHEMEAEANEHPLL